MFCTSIAIMLCTPEMCHLSTNDVEKECSKIRILITVYTRVQVERVYKSNPIFEAKNTTFLEKV